MDSSTSTTLSDGHSASHGPPASDEQLILKDRTELLYQRAWLVGATGIVLAVLLGYFFDHSLKRFFFAYLISFVYFLSLCLGGLFFTILQHLTKAAWSVNVRRIAEWLAASMPVMAIMSIPVVLPVLLHASQLYPWANVPANERGVMVAKPQAAQTDVASGTLNAQPAGANANINDRNSTSDKPEAPEEWSPFKKLYLNPIFWTARMVIYFAVWSLIGGWYWRQSLKQDKSGDIRLTVRMQMLSPICMMIFAVTLTLASFDFLMDLDPTWSSTIFGVYYFAGCVISIMASIIIAAVILQHFGYLRQSITIEHYHDLGKFLFGFTFFWGYIAFSQYMLQWYANLPEETLWYRNHGATTAVGSANGFSPVVVSLLFGHLLIPFGGLMSRHVKRNPVTLAFWAGWLLLFHWIDIYWIIMPQYDLHFHFNIPEICCFAGLGGCFFATILSRATRGALRPQHDPRLEASLEFQNI